MTLEILDMTSWHDKDLTLDRWFNTVPCWSTVAMLLPWPSVGRTPWSLAVETGQLWTCLVIIMIMITIIMMVNGYSDEGTDCCFCHFRTVNIHQFTGKKKPKFKERKSYLWQSLWRKICRNIGKIFSVVPKTLCSLKTYLAQSLVRKQHKCSIGKFNENKGSGWNK